MIIKHQLLLILIFSLSACIPGTDTPKQVAQKYWDAVQKGDHATVRKHVSKTSQEDLDSYLALPPDQKTTAHGISLGSEHAAVSTIINPNASSPEDQHTIETILVLEEGVWKVDASRSQLPPAKTTTEQELDELARQLSESMQENIDSMDGALSEGMKMLNEALRDGSKDMGESMLKLMQQLNERMKQSVDKMKQRNQQKNQQPMNEPPTQPDPDKGEGVI